MTELSEVLDRLGLLQYLGRLNDEGFDKWETVLDITEQDLATLNFKLGHRRILQREIASARGYLASQSLPINQQFTATDEFEQTPQEEKASPKFSRSADSVPRLLPTGTPTTVTSTGKRKYRRHPKVDENAPEKPPSAYVMFANNVRDSLKGQPLSFTDIAKLVGERWKVLPPEQKQTYEHEAQLAKEKFNAEFEEYKKTDHYREYLKYLTEFKSKNSSASGGGGGGAVGNANYGTTIGATSIDGRGASSTTSGDGTRARDSSTEHSEHKRPRLDISNTINSGSPATTVTTGSFQLIGNTGPPGTSGKVTGSTGSTYDGSSPVSPPPQAQRQFPPMVTGTLSPPGKTSDFSPYRDDRERNNHDTQLQQSDGERPTERSNDWPSPHSTHPERSHSDRPSSNHPDFLPRLQHYATAPHISQPPSYLRHKPSMMLSNTSYRRREDPFSPLGSISSSGSSTAPSITSLEDGSRSHRALPPILSPQQGYFDQRRPQSMGGSVGHTPISLPTPTPTGIVSGNYEREMERKRERGMTMENRGGYDRERGFREDYRENQHPGSLGSEGLPLPPRKPRPPSRGRPD